MLGWYGVSVRMIIIDVSETIRSLYYIHFYIFIYCKRLHLLFTSAIYILYIILVFTYIIYTCPNYIHCALILNINLILYYYRSTADKGHYQASDSSKHESR